jgi:hypothetical protein
MSSSTAPWQRLLTVEILQLHALTFYLHSLSYRTRLSTNWLAGWRPFHTSILVFSSQPDFQATSLRQLTGSVRVRVRVRVTLRLAVCRQSVRLGDKPVETQDQYFFFQQNTCGCSPYVTSSLTRGRVYRLRLLLVLASAVILRSESRGTHYHILLYEIRDSPNLEGQVPVFISPRNRVARLYPQALGTDQLN